MCVIIVEVSEPTDAVVAVLHITVEETARAEVGRMDISVFVLVGCPKKRRLVGFVETSTDPS